MGTGISLAVARRFGAMGFRIAMIGRTPERLAGVEAELRKAGVEARGFAADAGKEGQLRRAFGAIRETMGDTRVLVYNAVAMRQAPPMRLTAEEMTDDYRVNVVGALISAQEVAPAMKAAKRGSIFLTGGILATEPVSALCSLSAGKAAIRNLAFSLAKELQRDSIHVATITVGGFVREGTPLAPERVAEVFAELYAEPREGWQREIVFSG